MLKLGSIAFFIGCLFCKTTLADITPDVFEKAKAAFSKGESLDCAALCISTHDYFSEAQTAELLRIAVAGRNTALNLEHLTLTRNNLLLLASLLCQHNLSRLRLSNNVYDRNLSGMREFLVNATPHVTTLELRGYQFTCDAIIELSTAILTVPNAQQIIFERQFWDLNPLMQTLLRSYASARAAQNTPSGIEPQTLRLVQREIALLLWNQLHQGSDIPVQLNIAEPDTLKGQLQGELHNFHDGLISQIARALKEYFSKPLAQNVLKNILRVSDLAMVTPYDLALLLYGSAAELLWRSPSLNTNNLQQISDLRREYKRIILRYRTFMPWKITFGQLGIIGEKIVSEQQIDYWDSALPLFCPQVFSADDFSLWQEYQRDLPLPEGLLARQANGTIIVSCRSKLPMHAILELLLYGTLEEIVENLPELRNCNEELQNVINRLRIFYNNHLELLGSSEGVPLIEASAFNELHNVYLQRCCQRLQIESSSENYRLLLSGTFLEIFTQLFPQATHWEQERILEVINELRGRCSRISLTVQFYPLEPYSTSEVQNSVGCSVSAAEAIAEDDIAELKVVASNPSDEQLAKELPASRSANAGLPLADNAADEQESAKDDADHDEEEGHIYDWDILGAYAQQTGQQIGANTTLADKQDAEEPEPATTTTTVTTTTSSTTSWWRRIFSWGGEASPLVEDNLEQNWVNLSAPNNTVVGDPSLAAEDEQSKETAKNSETADEKTDNSTTSTVFVTGDAEEEDDDAETTVFASYFSSSSSLSSAQQ